MGRMATEIETNHATAGTLATTPTLTADTLSVSASADCTAADYTLYVRGGANNDVLGLSIGKTLVVATTGIETLEVNQLCGNARASLSVSLGPLRAAYQSAISETTVAPMTVVAALSCTYNGHTYGFNDMWTGDGGVSCMCVQGVSECGAGRANGVHMNGPEVAGVAISACVIFSVCVMFAYYKKMEKSAADARHVRRKSKDGVQDYYGSSADQEVELPAAAGRV